MSQPWWKLLEAIARLRVPIWSRSTAISVGDPRAMDARGTMDWASYVQAEALFDAWGPVPAGPWEAFHCVPLFAALDRIPRGQAGPTPARQAEALESLEILQLAAGRPPLIPDWLAAGVWAVVDLPGPQSVALAAQLVEAGMQPVCTFNHWPHPAAVLKPQDVLAQLLRHVTRVAESRSQLSAESPPVWICDRRRLGERPGKPREFDNRYFLDDSLLPGPQLLKEAGIHTVVYVLPERQSLLVEDLRVHAEDLKQKGLEVWGAAAVEQLAAFPLAAQPAPKADRLSGYHRSAAGGFGSLVPEPSSGGGG